MNIERYLGRAMLLRLETGQPITALSPAWAGVCGLLASGSATATGQTLALLVLLLLLVEPLMGGLWDLAVGAPASNRSATAAEGEVMPALPETQDRSPETVAPPIWQLLPYARRGSAGDRMMSWLAGGVAAWRQNRWSVVAFAFNLAFALAVASVLGYAVLGVAAAVPALALRVRWRSGPLAVVLSAIYDMLLPWLMGLSVLGGVVEHGLEPFAPVLALAGLYTIAYAACLAIAGGARLPALMALDAAQLAVVALLAARQETLAIWLVGLALIGQLPGHAAFVRGQAGTDYLRRAAVYIILGMVAAAVALAPALAGG